MRMALTLVLLILSYDLAAAQEAADQFVGVWNLVVIERVGVNGETVPLNRPYSKGQLIYTQGGHFAVQFSRPDRRPFESEEPTAEEALAAYRDYGARYGTFTVNDAEKTITHHQQDNLVLLTPGNVDMTFDYQFSGERMMWSRRILNNDPGYRFSGIEMIQTFVFERAE
jgi:hypothetical protein